MSFFISTLEEYYTGGLFLGVGNAITDGSIILIVLFSCLGIYGNEFFLDTLVPKSTLWEGSPELLGVDAMLIFGISVQVGTIALW